MLSGHLADFTCFKILRVTIRCFEDSESRQTMLSCEGCHVFALRTCRHFRSQLQRWKEVAESADTAGVTADSVRLVRGRTVQRTVKRVGHEKRTGFFSMTKIS